ncbi:MAG: DUF4276 family protein [Calditrichaeota bacterium]|nr:DUF4276 family protein [Calditrichota bacterium]
MVSEIRIYAEGGGDRSYTKTQLRTGLSKFLFTLIETGSKNGIHIRVIPCGSRSLAFRGFKLALRDHIDSLNILLVDSEGTVSEKGKSWSHLKQRRGDEWTKPRGVKDDNCQLMVQTMEAWIIADVETLAGFYGQGFSKNAIPSNQNVEEIEKADLERALNNATKRTQKGKYHKINHGCKLLEKINPDIVCEKAPHCDRLFKYLGSQIEG